MKKTDKDIQMLGPQAVMEGSLVFEGTLFMNGHVKGTIESRAGSIVIGEDALIHADIFVRTATVNGEIKGTVRATERIELYPPARVYGDLTAPVVVIHEGVIFEGNCAIKPKEDAVYQTDRKLSAKADKTAEPTESTAKSKAPAGSAKLTN
ncbi:MAG: polymer-forming cytoskeletal protein [Deltaproteobacteria bacterium]|jgi:cytoskeletal protein CcmA (bactofilin family)|nr:polymer-forming cytoskeletal protein [Deltaproteobacteria bacterium]